jgi:acetyl-CoA C-acetyltransferase
MGAVVIVSASRTPVGSFNGALSSLPAHALGAVAIKAALTQAGVDAAEIEEVILGQVLQAGAGQGPARQASIAAGVPNETPAWSLNQLCGSGLRAVALGAQQILEGDAGIVVAGGQESMSQAPHAAGLRNGQKMGDLAFVDTMIKDGLWDAFHGYHMGQTAENIAARWQITREDQDRFAVGSQNRAEAAQTSGRFAAEIAPVTISGRKGDTIVDKDEFIRHGVTLESIAGLRPAFAKEGTVTAANASGINDGGAALILMSEVEAARRGLKPLARIASWAHAGEPQGAEEGRVVRRRPRVGRIERGLRGPVPVRGPRARLRPGQGQRERGSDRHRPSDRRLRRAHPDNAAARDGPARRQEGTGHALRRRRHGCRPLRGARLIAQCGAVRAPREAMQRSHKGTETWRELRWSPAGPAALVTPSPPG